tara:strand:+ start:658 stop:951 length:294 start_codon:yes stop_codon:yes gene_type:complete
MATKGTNAKIKELKGIKPEKITDEQLKKVQEVISRINNAQMELGSMEIKKHNLMHAVNSIQEELGKLQADLEKEYGTVDINIKDGMINYKEDVKADS